MKTTLRIEAPDDLSVGTIKIVGESSELSDWISTPNNRSLSVDDLKPGIYSAEISPAGVQSRSVIFEVKDGESNQVQLPPFSALVSSGSNVNFFNPLSSQIVHGASESMISTFLNKLGSLHEPTLVHAPSQRESKAALLPLLDVARDERQISIGLSEGGKGQESFERFRGRTQIDVYPGRIELSILDDTDTSPASTHRMRLTTTIEGERIERCLLPLYRGGTRILVTAPPFAPADLELSITPADVRLRSIFRALDAGTLAEVSAVRDDVLGKLGDDLDPWTSILIGLLTIRYPEIFQPLTPQWTESLIQRAGWAFDAFVIRASQILTAAQTDDLDAQSEAVSNIVALLAKAQRCGAPYYRFTDHLFVEIASGVLNYLNQSNHSVSPLVASKFHRLYTRWQRELPLQRGAGPTFTWLARDLAELKTRRVLTPNRHPSGRLTSPKTTVVFEGTISAGKISVSPGRSIIAGAIHTNAESPAMVVRENDDGLSGAGEFPALSRPAGPTDDPNKGRFGGRTECAGYSLTASFEDGDNPDWVTAILLLQAPDTSSIGLGDYAWFFLHPTFSPQRLKVAFRGRRAHLRLRIWGGFTVGVWIPKACIELECDLSKIEGSPHIVRIR